MSTQHPDLMGYSAPYDLPSSMERSSRRPGCGCCAHCQCTGLCVEREADAQQLQQQIQGNIRSTNTSPSPIENYEEEEAAAKVHPNDFLSVNVNRRLERAPSPNLLQVFVDSSIAREKAKEEKTSPNKSNNHNLLEALERMTHPNDTIGTGTGGLGLLEVDDDINRRVSNVIPNANSHSARNIPRGGKAGLETGHVAYPIKPSHSRQASQTTDGDRNHFRSNSERCMQFTMESQSQEKKETTLQRDGSYQRFALEPKPYLTSYDTMRNTQQSNGQPLSRQLSNSSQRRDRYESHNDERFDRKVAPKMSEVKNMVRSASRSALRMASLDDKTVDDFVSAAKSTGRNVLRKAGFDNEVVVKNNDKRSQRPPSLLERKGITKEDFLLALRKTAAEEERRLASMIKSQTKEQVDTPSMDCLHPQQRASAVQRSFDVIHAGLPCTIHFVDRNGRDVDGVPVVAYRLVSDVNLGSKADGKKGMDWLKASHETGIKVKGKLYLGAGARGPILYELEPRRKAKVDGWLVRGATGYKPDFATRTHYGEYKNDFRHLYLRSPSGKAYKWYTSDGGKKMTFSGRSPEENGELFGEVTVTSSGTSHNHHHHHHHGYHRKAEKTSIKNVAITCHGGERLDPALICASWWCARQTVDESKVHQAHAEVRLIEEIEKAFEVDLLAAA